MFKKVNDKTIKVALDKIALKGVMDGIELTPIDCMSIIEHVSRLETKGDNK